MRRSGKHRPLQNPAHPGLEQRPYQVFSLSIFSSCKRTSSTFYSSLFHLCHFTMRCRPTKVNHCQSLQAHESQTLSIIAGPRKSTSRSESARPGSSPAKEANKDKTDAKEAKTTTGLPFPPYIMPKKATPLKLALTHKSANAYYQKGKDPQWIV